MKKILRIIKMLYWGITILLLILTIGTATYAWFTNNKKVETNTASTRTDEADLTLELSQQGGRGFQPVDEAAIVQVNQTRAEYLLPVSTTNLQDFVYNPGTVESQARYFQKVENEEYYYHGRIYLRAAAKGMREGTRMALYLDQAQEAGGELLQAASGELRSAARLGLVFNENYQNPVIFRFDDAYTSTQNAGNTFLNGTQLSEGQVLAWNGQGVSAVRDPSVTLNQFTIQMDNTSITLPQSPLLYMDYNQIYQVDVYFYIEGCDFDSAESIYRDEGNLHLAFYGIVAEEG